MTQRISVGGENFAALRKAGSYYVDKTELLYDLVYGTDNSVTLFTRPRRFGKTLMLSIMESFFSIGKKDHRQHAFGFPTGKLRISFRRLLWITSNKRLMTVRSEN